MAQIARVSQAEASEPRRRRLVVTIYVAVKEYPDAPFGSANDAFKRPNRRLCVVCCREYRLEAYATIKRC